MPAVASGVENVAPRFCTVSNNVIEGLNTSAAIKVVGAFVSGTLTDSALGCVVSNNIIQKGGNDANNISGSIQIYGTKNCAITGNTITNPLVCGVQLYIDNSGFVVSGNTIVDPNDSSFSAPSCVLSASNNNTGYIGGNTFVFSNGSLNTYVAKHSIRFTVGTTGNDVVIGKNALIGHDSTHLDFSGVSVAGINYTQMQSEQGTTTISITSGDSVSFVDVTYSKRFPVTPKVALTLTGSITGGGKTPIPYTSNKTATGVRIYVRPSDFTTFSASGSVTIDWEACT